MYQNFTFGIDPNFSLLICALRIKNELFFICKDKIKPTENQWEEQVESCPPSEFWGRIDWTFTCLLCLIFITKMDTKKIKKEGSKWRGGVILQLQLVRKSFILRIVLLPACTCVYICMYMPSCTCGYIC